MKFNLLNVKNLLIFSGVIIGFANPINASNDNLNMKAKDYSWNNNQTNKYKSKYGFDNDITSKKYKDDSNVKGSFDKYKLDFNKSFDDDLKIDDKFNLDDSESDDTDINSSSNKSFDNNLEINNNKSIFSDDDYDLKSNPYKADFNLDDEDLKPLKYNDENFKYKPSKKPCFGPNCTKSKDCVGSNCNKKGECLDSNCDESDYNDSELCFGSDCNNGNPISMSYSMSFSSRTDNNGTYVSQEQHSMFNDGKIGYRENEFSKGDSQGDIVKTEYDSSKFNTKSNKNFDKKDDSYTEKYSDFMNKELRDKRHMSYDKFMKSYKQYFNNNLLSNENRKQLPDSNYYNKDNNNEKFSGNNQDLDTDVSIEEDVE